MLFQDAILEFGFDCKVRKLSPKSINNYQKQLRYLQNYLEQEYRIKNVEQVRTAHIKMFLAMMDDKQRKPRYINDLLKAFKTFFNYLKREGHIQENPTTKVKNMKQPKTKILTFSEDEIRRLLNHFGGKNFLSLRNRAILAMFFDTGMRLTEVITLKPEQIHDEYILVHGKGSKERVVPVSPYLAKTLMKYRMAREAYFEDKLPEPYVFLSNRGKKLTQEAIAKFFKQAAVEVRINSQVRVSPHTCTLTASFAKRAGMVGTAEYNYLVSLRKSNPGLVVLKATHASPTPKTDENGNPKPRDPFDKVSYKAMEDYMSLCRDKDAYQKEFKNIRLLSKGQPVPYQFVRKWFKAKFPLFGSIDVQHDADGYIVERINNIISYSMSKRVISMDTSIFQAKQSFPLSLTLLAPSMMESLWLKKGVSMAILIPQVKP